MARNDWTALVTEPAQEYSARVELERFGLHPYLPQLSRRWVPPHGSPLPRRCPLFPRYLLLPIAEAEHRALRHARGLRKIRPVLANEIGRLWRCPAAVIEAIRLAESTGEFDELTVTVSKLRLADGVLALISAKMASPTGTNRVELLTPLFGGVKVTVSSSRLVRA